MLMSEQTINTTRISAVAVIADRTAYNVRYTGKLSNRFRLQVDKRLVYARSDTTGIMNAPKPYPLKRDWPKFTNNRTTTSARLIVCLKNSRAFSLTFSPGVLWPNDTSYSKDVRTDK